MKLTDYVVDFLASIGVNHVFGLTGGAVAHLFDSADKNKKVTPVFCHHEQAAAFAAQAYARARKSLGAAFFTTGPGGTNAITGVLGAWLDSVPCIYISGQARIEHTSTGKGIRQLGTQEFDIISLVSHITKYAVLIDDPKMIKYHLQKAAYLARNQRPGPVWIDIPLNYQWIDIEPDKLLSFDPDELCDQEVNNEDFDIIIDNCISMIKSSTRPIFLAGYGIKLAQAENEFKELIKLLHIPFVSSWNASDICPTDSKTYLGRPGIAGQRGANLAIQNSDLVIGFGSHFCIQLTGGTYNAFARDAKVIMVDIDQAELKNQTVRIDLPVNMDVKLFLGKITEKIKNEPIGAKNIWSLWRRKCREYKTLNDTPRIWKDQENFINPYVFIDYVTGIMGPNDNVVVDGGGAVVYSSFQGVRLKRNQRIFISSGLCAMGSGVPESIGVCFANNLKNNTVCFCGDGSLQLNIQELQTIFHHNLPIKIFIFNNDGYLSIRQTQDGFLESNYVGSDPKGGLSLPNYLKVANAYGINAIRISNHKEFEKIPAMLDYPGPFLCELMISRTQAIIPSQGFERNKNGTFSPRPLEDMYPHLDRHVFEKLMLIPAWKSSN